MMRIEVLARPFEAIGARLHIKIAEARPGLRMRRGQLQSATEDLTLDVTQDRLGEVFTLTIRSDVAGTLELQALNVQPKRRHLLLLATRRDLAGDRRKFLCGHDARHWFVAPVPETRGVTRMK